MPLFAIPVTLSKEVGGHTMVSDLRWAAPLSSVKGRFDGQIPHCNFMTYMFCYPLVVVDIGGREVYQVLVLQLLVLQSPWGLRLIVDSVMLPTDPPPGTHGGANISETGGRAARNLYFQTLRTPCLCEESVLCE